MSMGRPGGYYAIFMICSAEFTHNFWCTHWHTLSPTRKTATAAFICSRIDREFASSAQSSDNHQTDENDLGTLKLIGGKQHFFLNTKKWRIPFVVAGIETVRERQWTTGRANQTTGLTNGRAANRALEVAFCLFRSPSRRQLMFPLRC